MNDLIEQLRDFEGSDDLSNGDFSVCVKAADLIEAQQAEIARLRGALEEAVQWIDADDCTRMGPAEDAAHTRIIRRLDAALSAQTIAPPTPCEYCDGTGEVHSIHGDWLGPCPDCRTSADEVPQDVQRLVIAARTMAFGDWFGEGEDYEVARKELDDASEAFASRIPWPDQPEDGE